MFAARRGLKRLDHYGRFQPEIQEARAGDFSLFAKFRNIEFGQHVRGKLARIHFPRLGQRHQRVALVIAKFGIGARTDKNHGGVSFRQNRANGGLKLQFNLFVRQHLFVELLKS